MMNRRHFGRTLGGVALAAMLPAPLRAASDKTASLAGLGVAEAAAQIRDGALTAAALVDACLSRIAVYDPKINSFITLFADSARAEAQALDRERAAGKLRGPLHGVVLSVKDNIDTGGQRTTGGSPAFQMNVPAQDAPAIAALRAAGAIIIGKNTLNELAMSDGRSSFYGTVRNPWNLAHATGGSSSGSCAGVMAGLVQGAIGTDTGGSIRNPAAWCGLVGLKPTSGLVSNRGTIPLTPSLDTIGPITRSVADAALLLTAIAGYDRLDITSEPHPREDYLAAMGQPVSGLRVGTMLGHFDRLDPEVAAIIDRAIGVIRGMTAGFQPDVTLPDGDEAMQLMPFGETYAWYEPYMRANPYQFSAVDRATLDSLSQQKAQDYIRARWKMDLLRRTVDDSFAQVDVMLFPTVHTPAPLLIANSPSDPDGARDRAALFDAGLLNVLGLPGVSVPCGFTASGLPIGLCLVGPRFGEGRLLALAHAYEQATPWHNRRPPLLPGMKVPPIPKMG